MSKIALCYSYMRNDEAMIYLCRMELVGRYTLKEIGQQVRARIEAEGGPVTEFKLLRQNDLIDKIMLDAMEGN